MSNDKPIIFCGDMVRAILEGRKTQTRRVVRHTLDMSNNMMEGEESEWCPYGPVGTRLWVRENWRCAGRNRFWGIEYVADGAFNGNFGRPRQDQIAYIATRHAGNVRPSIHMPRWASRLTLEVTDIRAQRVQEISEEDARTEGVKGAIVSADTGERAGFVTDFAYLWDSINAKRGYGWSVNPWVWAVTFRVAEGGGR